MNKSKQIKVKYFASLKEQAKKEAEELTTEAQSAVELYEELTQKYRFTLSKEYVGVAINDQLKSQKDPLTCGDTVVYIPPVAGG